MTKYINADEFIATLKDWDKNSDNPMVTKDVKMGIRMSISEAITMPAADVAEVVRCKDCKYWEYKCNDDYDGFDISYGDCNYWGMEHQCTASFETTGNHYCGYARERKAK